MSHEDVFEGEIVESSGTATERVEITAPASIIDPEYKKRQDSFEQQKLLIEEKYERYGYKSDDWAIGVAERELASAVADDLRNPSAFNSEKLERRQLQLEEAQQAKARKIKHDTLQKEKEIVELRRQILGE